MGLIPDIDLTLGTVGNSYLKDARDRFRFLVVALVSNMTSSTYQKLALALTVFCTTLEDEIGKGGAIR